MITQLTSLSIIIPILNEEDVLPELKKRLMAVLSGLPMQSEVIFIDDGSSDRSFEILETFHREDNRIKAIQFSRNFGHHIAITAGLDHASGDIVVLMDGDLQNRPEDIPRLLYKIIEGYDIVYTIRKNRQDSIFAKASSRLFIWVMARIVREPIAVETSIFRAMRSNVVKAIRELQERNRFLIGLINWTGFAQTQIEVLHNKRFAGKTKYPFKKRFSLALDAMFSFSVFPLQLATILGFLITSFSFGYGAYIMIRKIVWELTSPGFASLIVSIFFIGGVQLFILGILGSYIARIYTEVKRRPLYIIKKIID